MCWVCHRGTEKVSYLNERDGSNLVVRILSVMSDLNCDANEPVTVYKCANFSVTSV